MTGRRQCLRLLSGLGSAALAAGLAGLRPVLAADPAAVSTTTADPAVVKFKELYDGNGITGLVLSARVQALAGHRVAMRGYMAPPLKAEASFFVLTRTPVNLCPFCDSDADWPVDIIVVYPDGDADFTLGGVPIEVTGLLEVGGYTDPGSRFFSRLRLRQARVAPLG